VPRPSNESLALVPRPLEGGRGLDFDFPGLEIGAAEYAEGPTGCTVFHFPERAIVAIDVRGGAPGWSGGDGLVDAICLAGGSAYGLEAISGVRAELLARRGYSTDWLDIALVVGAIIYDFGPRDSAVYPDAALGRAALRSARPGWFPLGPRGAGRSATVGKLLRGRDGRETAGQGGAFRQVGPIRVAVFTVVNAVGAIVDRRGRVVRGNRDPATGARGDLLDDLERSLAEATSPPPGNTTLTVVVTDRRLSAYELRQLGRQVHASMARAIQPFHAPTDGDVLFAVTTGAVDDDRLPSTLLATLASELAWDAVLTSASPLSS
jgi:L-aminopeptidase/D-esterase-like protein